MVVSDLIAVLPVCHEMFAFARPGAEESRLAKWVQRIFAIITDMFCICGGRTGDALWRC